MNALSTRGVRAPSDRTREGHWLRKKGGAWREVDGRRRSAHRCRRQGLRAPGLETEPPRMERGGRCGTGMCRSRPRRREMATTIPLPRGAVGSATQALPPGRAQRHDRCPAPGTNQPGRRAIRSRLARDRTAGADRCSGRPTRLGGRCAGRWPSRCGIPVSPRRERARPHVLPHVPPLTSVAGACSGPRCVDGERRQALPLCGR